MTSRLFAIALLGTLAVPAFAATPIDETRPLDARGKLEVENLKGRIEVRTWDRPEVRITGSLGDGVERLEIGDGGGELSVRVRYPRNSRNTEPTTLVLDVPRQASVDVDSVAADIEVNGIAGASLDIESVSGEIVAIGAPGKASVESVSGDLRLNLNSRDVDAESVSGNIALRGRISGEVGVETVSGNIDVDSRGERMQRVDSSSVSGDAAIRGALAGSGSISAESVSGDIRVTLPRGLSARVKGSSFSGTLDAPDATIHKERFGPGASFEHSYGAGDGEISIETFSGDAELRLE